MPRASKATAVPAVIAPHIFAVKIDTREQSPFTFPADVVTVTGTLSTGDYSAVGHESEIAIERKSIPDLVASVTRENQRFQACLARLSALRFAAVVIEGSPHDLEQQRLFSRVPSSTVLDVIATLTLKHRVPFFWAGSRVHAAAMTRRFLYKYWLMRNDERRKAAAAALQAALTSEGGS